MASGLDVGDEKKSEQKVLEKIEARIRAGVKLGEAEEGPVTVRRYVVRWTEERRKTNAILPVLTTTPHASGFTRCP